MPRGSFNTYFDLPPQLRVTYSRIQSIFSIVPLAKVLLHMTLHILCNEKRFQI